MSTLVLSGNPRPGSRTSAVATQLATALADATGAGPVAVVELADLAPEVLVGGRELTAARELVLAARLLVVATPVYKGAYTGLLKAFLDTYEAGALASVTAVGLVVAGQDAHLHAGETHLRPVLLELGAQVPAPTLALPQRSFDERGAAVADWVARNAPAVAGALSRSTSSTPEVPA